MSNSTPPAWYPDPAGSGQLRFWDGAQWTQHLAPATDQVSPQQHAPAAATPAPTPPQTPPTSPQVPPQQQYTPTAPPAAEEPSQEVPPTAQQVPPTAQQVPPTAQQYPPTAQQYPSSSHEYPPAAHQYPPTSQQVPPQHQPYAPQYAPTQAMQGKATHTPDGVPLASYGSRVGAYLLDFLITTTVGLVVSSPFLSAFFSWFNSYIRIVGYGGTPNQAYIQSQVLYYLWPMTLIMLIITVVYNVVFLTWRGATPGKMATKIRVRTWDAPGNPTYAVALRRQLIFIGVTLLSFVPVVSTLASISSIVDVLWPLWDNRRQALHDKIAGTVVVTDQPR